MLLISAGYDVVIAEDGFAALLQLRKTDSLRNGDLCGVPASVSVGRNRREDWASSGSAMPLLSEPEPIRH
jgi:hypothetical protein